MFKHQELPVGWISLVRERQKSTAPEGFNSETLGKAKPVPTLKTFTVYTRNLELCVYIYRGIDSSTLSKLSHTSYFSGWLSTLLPVGLFQSANFAHFHPVAEKAKILSK